jgi:hypothetical protein
MLLAVDPAALISSGTDHSAVAANASEDRQ